MSLAVFGRPSTVLVLSTPLDTAVLDVQALRQAAAPLQCESEYLERYQLFIMTQHLHHSSQLQPVHKANWQIDTTIQAMNVTASTNKSINEKVRIGTSIC